MRRALPTCGTCGASGARHRAVRLIADHVRAKVEMLQLRLMEKERELVRLADVDELIDQIAGVTLTAACLRDARRVATSRLGAQSSGSSSRCEPRSPMSASRLPTSAVSRRSTP
jgi:hypothetical protein